MVKLGEKIHQRLDISAEAGNETKFTSFQKHYKAKEHGDVK